MVIYPEMFSVKPNIEATIPFRNLFNTCTKTSVSKTLSVPKGNYVFLSENADVREMYISNTIAEKEYPEGMEKNIHRTALVIENVKNMEIDFNDSNFIMHGLLSHILIKNCSGITIKNLNIEHIKPNVHKLTVEKASPFYVTFKIDESSDYIEENGKYYWIGKDYKLCFTDYKNSGGWMSTARPSNYNHIKRNDFHPFRDASLIRQVADRTFNVRYISPKDYVVGQVFYVYPTVRLECGIIVDSSSDITFKNVKQRFNYSLALVAQNSENITLEDSDFSPGDTEVDFTSFADFMQFSMCRGRVAVRNCNFDAAGDDTCNVHGFHFKILEADRNRLVVGFGHNQSYGFECIRPGDVIAYVNPETLLEEGRAIVSQARLIDKYRYELTVSSYECPVGVGGVIENVSANPSFEFSGNVINRIVTRGLLVTTRGKVVIENNRFLNTGASGILISDDANNWYESGCCLDVTIRGNAFMNCEENAILIKPEIKKYAGPVHRNILIENNLFVLNNIHALNVSDSSDIVMKGNVYKGIPKDNKWIVAKNTRNIVTDCPG